MIAGLLATAMAHLGLLHAMFVHLTNTTSQHGGSLLLLAAGPAAGLLVYRGIYRRYRNANKSFNFERETVIAEIVPITGSDTKIDHIQGSHDMRIQGDNSKHDRQRVQRLQYPES